MALTQSEEDKTTISNGTINDLKASLTEEEFNGYAEIINKSSLVGQDEDDPSELCVDDLECNCLFLMFDIETTGLHRHIQTSYRFHVHRKIEALNFQGTDFLQKISQTLPQEYMNKC